MSFFFARADLILFIYFILTFFFFLLHFLPFSSAFFPHLSFCVVYEPHGSSLSIVGGGHREAMLVKGR